MMSKIDEMSKLVDPNRAEDAELIKEQFGVLLGKLKSSVKDFVTHITSKNPDVGEIVGTHNNQTASVAARQGDELGDKQDHTQNPYDISDFPGIFYIYLLIC